MDSITSRARSAFRWTLSLRLLSQVFTWLSTLFVIRFLTPADYGVVAIADMVLMLALQLASAGLGDVLIRQKQLTKHFTRQLLFLLILLNGAMALFQLSLAGSIARFYNQPVVEYVLYSTSALYLLMPWITISSSLLARDMNFKSRSQVDFAASLLSSATALILAYTGFGFWALVIANMLLISCRALGYTLALKTFYIPLASLTGMGPAFKFGLTVMCTGFLFTLFMKADIMVAGRFIDATELGFYAVAIHLALMPMSKAMPLVNEVAYPMYAAIQHDRTEYQRVFCYLLRIITLFCFPFFYGFAAISEELVNLILGSQWQASALPLQLILLTIPLRIISNLFTPLMKALGLPSTGLIHVSFSLVLTVIAIYLASNDGIVAIAASWLITAPLFFLFALYLCTARSGISTFTVLKAVSPPFLLSAVMFCALLGMKFIWLDDINTLMRLLIMVISGALIYIAGLRLLFSQRFFEALKFRL